MKKTSLVSCAIFLMMAGQAMAWPPSEVTIEPENPTSADVVAITLEGGWGDSCVPNASAISVSGYDIYFDVIHDYPAGIYCLTVISGWERTESIGPLAPGTYTVYARLRRTVSIWWDWPARDWPAREREEYTEEYIQVAEFVVAGDSEPVDGLIAHWTFDEGEGNTAYDSAGDNHGTIHGAQWAEGPIGGALEFDGVDDYVDLGNDNSLKPPLPVTISAWIKLSVLELDGQIIGLDDQSSRYYGIWIHTGRGKQIAVGYGDGGTHYPQNRRSKSGTTALEADVWYHVTTVVKSATDMDIYINGANDGGSYGGTGGNLTYSSGSSSIGSRLGLSIEFNGLIDDVRIYNRALSAEEIGELYEEGLGGLVAHWTFDEGEGDTAHDSAGENDGAIYGAQWTDGKIGGALDFDGAHDYVDCGSDESLDLGSGSFTIAAWVKTSGMNEIYARIVSHYCGGHPGHYQLVGTWVDGSHHAGVGIRGNNLNQIKISGTTNIEDGNWHHVVGVRDGDTLYLYVDALLEGEPADVGAIGDVVGSEPWTIGVAKDYRGVTAGYFNGTIDDVRIYNRALSADEIGDIYKEGLGVYHVFLDDFADDETRGRFVMEAENYSARSLGSSSAWWEVDGSDSRFIEGPNVGQVAPTRKAGARDNYMETLGDGTLNVAPIDESYDGPFLDYRVSVETPGTYRLYARWLGRDKGSDSLYAFILKPDETVLTGAGPNYFLYHQYRSSWIWDSRGVQNTTRCAGAGFPHAAVWTISQPGIYTIRIAQRESTTALDALVFQTEGLSGPSGFGPPQSQYIPGPARPTQYHVDAVGGSDTNNGWSRETAFATIQRGIDAVEDGETVVVWPGLYLKTDPASDNSINFAGKSITLTSADPTDADTVDNTVIRGYVQFTGAEGPDAKLTGFTISDPYDGAIYGNHTEASLSHCVISGSGSVGSTVIMSWDGTISNCLITDNFKCLDCGALSLPLIFGCSGLVKNCTIADNASSVAVFSGDTLTMENCIIYNNDGPQLQIAGGGILNISYCDVQDGLEGIEGTGTVNWGPGNIDAEPLFADAVEGDYHLLSERGRYWPKYDVWVLEDVTSPCIDGGNPADDVGEEPMPNGGRINMGAYGGTAYASMSERIANDIDGDRVPDEEDNCPDDYNPDQKDWDDDGLGNVCDWCPCPGDENGDGQIDLNDLSIMVDFFVNAGPPFLCVVWPPRCDGELAVPYGQTDLQDLDALVNMLVNAGAPFIVPCE